MAQPVTTGNATNLSDCTCPLANYTGGKCWPGAYCPNGTAYPVPCTGGYYCMQYGLASPEGLCNAGYFCNGSDTQPDPSDQVCPVGHYCEQGSATPTPCPSGTMSNTAGNTNLTDCNSCTPGYYCAGTGNTNYTGPCAPNYYCPSGQQSSTPNEYNCTIGHYCPGETGQPLPCVAGFYQDNEGMSSCKNCPAGR